MPDLGRFGGKRLQVSTNIFGGASVRFWILLVAEGLVKTVLEKYWGISYSRLTSRLGTLKTHADLTIRRADGYLRYKFSV